MVHTVKTRQSDNVPTFHLAAVAVSGLLLPGLSLEI